MEKYSLFATLKKELESFYEDSILIATPEAGDNNVRYLKRNSGGFIFNQHKTLNLIDLYYNSKFETGTVDSQGQRKLFLNTCKFRADVAAKQTDLDVKDYVFIPDNFESIWRTWFMARQFKVWTRENNYGRLINELNIDFSKYGTAVVKRVKKGLERVPLRSLINSQDAKSLLLAATTGGYVIEKHEFSEYELQQFKNWNTENVECPEDGKAVVYERYGLCNRSVLDEYNGVQTKRADDKDEYVLTMAILTPNTVENGKTIGGQLLFIQEITEKDFPYEEVHWSKQDGRWLGIGEIENQIENQIARNMSANLRRRALLWASKKLFQSTDEAVQKNLVKDVSDGQVMHIAPNGNISQINMATSSLAEFNSDDQMWEQNSNQKSFTFEVATGEALPSGTPFRLGVLLSDATQTHFKLKKQEFGMFLIRAYFNLLIPIFKKDTKEHNVSVAGSEEGVRHLQEAIKDYYRWDKFKSMILNGTVPTPEELDMHVGAFMEKQQYHFIEIPSKFYDDAQFHMELEVTGQAVDTKQEIETLTNIFMTASKNPAVLQDPNMRRILEMIVSRTGKTLGEFLGPMSKVTQQPMAPAGGMPAINAPTQSGGAANLPIA
jgi:hypothetical protein